MKKYFVSLVVAISILALASLSFACDSYSCVQTSASSMASSMGLQIGNGKTTGQASNTTTAIAQNFKVPGGVASAPSVVTSGSIKNTGAGLVISGFAGQGSASAYSTKCKR